MTNTTKPQFDPTDPNSKLYSTQGGGKKPTGLGVFIFLGVAVVVGILLVVILT